MLMMLMLLLLLDLEIIGTAQAIEESDGSDDEWNYIKVEDKKEEVEQVEQVEDEQPEYTHNNQEEQIVESPVVEEEKYVEEEEKTVPIEAADHSEQFVENLTESDNRNIVEEEEQKGEIIEQEIALVEEEKLPEDQPIEEECQLIESSIVESETEKEILQEKEPVEEERHVLDEIEKDLALQVDTEDSNDMDSQLNPDAKEFVPLSPVRNEFQSPPPGLENGKSPFVNQILSGFTDPVLSQSPRKGETKIMDDVTIPELNEFEKEADARAHEVHLNEENFHAIESPQEEELNLKEAMQADDKLEQGYKDDSQGFFEEEKIQIGDEYKVLESSFDQYSNGFQNKVDDPMNRSFYEGRDNDILADPAKSELNTTQQLSDDEEVQQEQPTNDIKPVEEIDFIGGGGEPVFEQINVVNHFETMHEKEPISQMESSDNFEAEKFVEEIKGINESFNKYVDTELSPTVPKEVISNEIQTVEETIFATHSPMKPVMDTNLDTFITQTSTVSDIVTEVTETKQSIIDEFDILQSEIKENIPEAIEAVQQELIPTMEAPAHEVTPPVETVEEKLLEPEIPKVDEAKFESKTEEVVAAAAVATALVAAGTAAAVTKKPSSTTAAKKPADTKKVGDVKAKAAPSKPAEVKKTDVKPKTTTTTKPSTTTAAAKPPLSKPAPAKPASTLAARPKTTTVPPVKKAPVSSTAKPAEAKPPVSKTSTVPKRPISSAPTTRPTQPKPAPEVKSKVSGTTTERKPLASSAPATRAPAKPTSLTVKSRVNGTTSSATTTAKSPSATKTTSARLSTSAIEKSASSPLKEKSLNKSLSATTAKSPRTVTSTSTTKTTTLKSPLSATTKPLSAVGMKKPLTTAAKKSPIEKTSTTTVTKKPATVGATKTSTTVKKTTTTTVVKKKVVNGDIVEEKKTTTTTESAVDVPALNGHHVNGSGGEENGVAHESEQQAVIEPTAN